MSVLELHKKGKNLTMENSEKESKDYITILKEKKKNKIPEKTLKKIFINIFFAIIVMLYFFIINIAYTGLTLDKLEEAIQLFSGIYLFVGLIFLEKAYKQDSGEKTIISMELMVVSMYSLSILHIIKKYQFDFQIYLTASSYICAIYFVLKSIIIYTRSKMEILEGISDVKEIVKKEKPIKKEATKREPKKEIEEIKRKPNKKSVSKNSINKKPASKNQTSKKSTSKNLTTKKSVSKNSTNKKSTNKKTKKTEKTIKSN